jgi:hypothetical protein
MHVASSCGSIFGGNTVVVVGARAFPPPYVGYDNYIIVSTSDRLPT